MEGSTGGKDETTPPSLESANTSVFGGSSGKSVGYVRGEASTGDNDSFLFLLNLKQLTSRPRLVSPARSTSHSTRTRQPSEEDVAATAGGGFGISCRCLPFRPAIRSRSRLFAPSSSSLRPHSVALKRLCRHPGQSWISSGKAAILGQSSLLRGAVGSPSTMVVVVVVGPDGRKQFSGSRKNVAWVAGSATSDT